MKVALLIPDNRDEFRQYAEPAPSFGPAPAALLEGLAGLPECETHVLACTHRPLAAPAQLAANVHYHSLLVRPWGWLRSGYLGCVLALRKRLRALRPNLVHGQGTERYCALAAAFSGRPNLVTIHGNMRRLAALLRARPFSFHWLAARLEKVAVARTGGIVCLTRHTQRAVEGLARRAWLVPNAVEAAFFDVPRQANPEPVVLCVGHVLPWKNQVGLIRALEPLAARRSFQLLFLGKTDPALAYCAEFAELVRSRPWCHYAGPANKAELQGALGRAALLVVPSLEDNCPMVILEAMAAGLPVVGSLAGGIPDLIEEGQTGFLSDPHDAARLGQRVEQLLDNQALARQMGARARQAALERFHPRVVAQRHLQVYAELLESARTGKVEP